MPKDNVRYDTPWRRMATAIYRPPRDGRTYGTFELDVTYLLKYIQKQKRKGIHLTVTQVISSAFGRALSEDIPELNSYVKRGRVVPRESVDIFIAVSIPNSKEMTGFSFRQIDQKSLVDISEEMAARVDKARKRQESGVAKNKNILAKIPWPFRNWVFNFIRWMTVDMSIPLNFMKINANSFGSAMITNIGVFGLQYGFAALMPASNIPIVIAMGKADKKPVVRNNKVVIRDIMPLGGVFDHRIVDGGQGGKLAMAVQKYIEKPELLEVPVESKTE